MAIEERASSERVGFAQHRGAYSRFCAYSAQELIEGFHNFEARLAELSEENPNGFKFFVDSAKGEAPGSSPSLPGFLSFLVGEEAQVEDEKVFTVFNTLFNTLIERTQKERPFDRLLDDFVHRMGVRN